MKKQILCLMTYPPYGLHRGTELLDASLMLAALGHEISLAFIGDGVWHLLRQQQPEQLPLKPYTKALKALGLYEIQQVYVTCEDLAQRNLQAEQLLVKLNIIAQTELRELMDQKDFILTV